MKDQVRERLPTTALVAFVLALVVVLTSPTTRSWRAAAGIEPQPQRTTTLELLHHLSTPASILADQRITLLVRVGNKEGTAENYAVESFVDDGVRGVEIVRNSPVAVDIDDGESKDISVSFKPRCAGRLRVTIALADRPESLHVWITSAGRTKEVKRCA